MSPGTTLYGSTDALVIVGVSLFFSAMAVRDKNDMTNSDAAISFAFPLLCTNSLIVYTFFVRKVYIVY